MEEIFFRLKNMMTTMPRAAPLSLLPPQGTASVEDDAQAEDEDNGSQGSPAAGKEALTAAKKSADGGNTEKEKKP